eukprot:403362461
MSTHSRLQFSQNEIRCDTNLNFLGSNNSYSTSQNGQINQILSPRTSMGYGVNNKSQDYQKRKQNQTLGNNDKITGQRYKSRENITKKQVLQNFLEQNYSTQVMKLKQKQGINYNNSQQKEVFTVDSENEQKNILSFRNIRDEQKSNSNFKILRTLSPMRESNRYNELDNLNEECSFKPNLNQKSIKIVNQTRKSQERSKERLFNELYHESVELQIKKKILREKAQQEKDEKLNQQLTFKPQIYQYKPHKVYQQILPMNEIQSLNQVSGYGEQYLKKRILNFSKNQQQANSVRQSQDSTTSIKAYSQFQKSQVNSPLKQSNKKLSKQSINSNKKLQKENISPKSLVQLENINNQCSTLELVRQITNKLNFDQFVTDSSKSVDETSITQSQKKQQITRISDKYQSQEKLINENKNQRKIRHISASSREIKKQSNSSVQSLGSQIQLFNNTNNTESDLLEFNPDQFMYDTQNVVFEVIPFNRADSNIIQLSQFTNEILPSQYQMNSQAIQILDNNSDSYQSPAYNQSEDRTPQVHEILNTDSNNKSYFDSSPSEQYQHPLRLDNNIVTHSFNLSPIRDFNNQNQQSMPTYQNTQQTQQNKRTSNNINQKSLSMIIEDKGEVTQSSVFETSGYIMSGCPGGTASSIMNQSLRNSNNSSSYVINSSRQLNLYNSNSSKFCKEASSIHDKDDDQFNSSVINLYYNIN